MIFLKIPTSIICFLSPLFAKYIPLIIIFLLMLPCQSSSENADHAQNALQFSTVADQFLTQGDKKKAIQYLENAAKEAKLAGNPHIEATILNDIGNLFSVFNDYEKAIEAYQKALKLIERLNNTENLKLKVFINILRARYEYESLFQRMQFPDEGENSQFNRSQGDQKIRISGADFIKEMKMTLNEIRSQPDSSDKISNLFSLSLLALKMDKNEAFNRTLPADNDIFPLIYQSLDEARQLSETLHDIRSASYAYGYIGQLYESRKRFKESMALTRKAIFLAQQVNAPEIIYRWQWQMGRLYNAADDRENAVKSYQTALSTLNPVCSQLTKGYRGRKNAFEEEVKPVYLGLAEIKLHQSALSPENMRKQLLIDAVDIMENLKTAELQDFYRDECVSSKQKKGVELGQTPPNTAIMYLILLPRQPVLLLSLPDGVKQIPLPVDTDLLRETAKQFRRKLQTWSDFKTDAANLYDWLIRPIEPELSKQSIHTLILAPDGALRLIPFSALFDGRQFVIEKYALATIPALTLANLNLEKLYSPVNASPLASSNKVRTLMIGVSEGRSDKDWEFLPLPGVIKELAAIQNMIGGKTLLNKDCTLDNLNTEFKNHEYSIIHIATHGVFGDTSEDSFLLTYDGRLNMDRLEQMIHLGRYRDNPVDLLTLSACQTAMGDERAAFGLAGVAVKAGVNSAIATLWAVDDKSSFEVISEFYRELKTGVSKAKALQNAQKKLIKHHRFAHPGFWSAFLLIGNWS